MTKTSDFTLDGFLPYLLNQAAECAGRTFAQVYKDRHGIDRTQWRVLAHLGEAETLTATDIAERAMMYRAKVSRAVFALEQRGWLARRRDTNDRRVEHLRLTTTGRAVYETLCEDAAAHQRKLVERLGPAQARALAEALEVLRSPES